VLGDFALAILIGVLVGTYSSVFVAAPIVLWWTGWRGDQASASRIESGSGEPRTGSAS
jgi:preprotein translocase subunit SecF